MRKNTATALNADSQSLEVVNQIINACADAKGKDISVLEVSEFFGMADYFVVVSGRSDRQVQGIANKTLEALESGGITPVSLEGMETGHWVLIDTGDVIVHVFYEPVREHYDLESLWSKARKLSIRMRRKSSGTELRVYS